MGKQDTLSPNELPSGQITTGKTNQALDAVLTQTLVDEVVDGELSIQFTNRQGDEQQVMLVYYRQALDTDPDSAGFGGRKYQTHIICSSKVVPLGSSPAQGAADTNTYSIAITSVTKTPWGVTLTTTDNGATRAAKLIYQGDYPLMLKQFLGNGTLTTFNLDYAPISTAKTKAWKVSDGSTLAVSAIDATNKTVTFGTPPTYNVSYVVAHETDQAIV